MFLKILASFVFMALAYRFYFSKTYVALHQPDFILPLPTRAEKCDVFRGEWVRDPEGPAYTSSSCGTIERHQNCIKNGRPDSGYMYWRWRPRDCKLPRFDPKAFLRFMRNKSMAFIGDSISRNHVQSLLCILSQMEPPVEVYHDKGYRSKRWFFESHNFTLSVIWSPFLTEAKIFEDNDGHASGAVRLHLDEPGPEWADGFDKFDYVKIGAGKWFLKTAVYYENNTIIGCHNCKIVNVTEVRFDYAYRRALQTTLNFIRKSDHKVYTLFQTTTPDHFENGEWNTGGYCNRTVPFKEGEAELRDIDTIMRDVELEEFKKAVGDTNGSTFKLFDTTRLALLRPDGHPGPYRAFHPFEGKDFNDARVQNDCLHWCLPGPIDSWNDLLINILLRE
ncbi:hypothetical protein SSX86_012447 [Deinandra increscens subsp. villosa]|uniref:Trichome birefringence-like N-terminal domain-containing protein n=1 Tax=Deinandra increscens subsp. villosa TaxID=3103831 RepID=A0AAP0D4A1_9ASTR